MFFIKDVSLNDPSLLEEMTALEVLLVKRDVLLSFLKDVPSNDPSLFGEMVLFVDVLVKRAVLHFSQ